MGLDVDAISPTGSVVSFRAGSYSTYNRWREALAAMIGTTPQRIWDDPKPGPFVELINFSDCEGRHDAATCAKLARDFEEWQERANAYEPAAYEPEYFRKTYSDFRRAFELGALGGYVVFC